MSWISGLYKLAFIKKAHKPLARKRQVGKSVKISHEDVIELRRLHAAGRIKKGDEKKLAAKYGVHFMTINGILDYRYRSHPFDPMDPDLTDKTR